MKFLTLPHCITGGKHAEQAAIGQTATPAMWATSASLMQTKSRAFLPIETVNNNFKVSGYQSQSLVPA
jgi:hypothetical protein